MTIDQRASRRHGDRVPELLGALPGPGDDGVVLAFDRTVGDEVQGVLDDAATVVDVVLLAARLGEWSVGVGVGPVDEPLPASTRAGTGAAFVRAREAVERAKRRAGGAPVAVVGADRGPQADRAAEAESVLQLLASVAERRTAAGWEVVDLLRDGLSQRAAAERLGVSGQAVSQRVRASMWPEEAAARPLAARLLEEADAS
ncbi:hypothetical protein [Luteimicrobium sp. DT211]|uniref:hypothetical protein n=1 Tax=Luteimicrobium sp. DT211 TaxID=3393412 RepID=UPI003CF7E210